MIQSTKEIMIQLFKTYNNVPENTPDQAISKFVAINAAVAGWRSKLLNILGNDSIATKLSDQSMDVRAQLDQLAQTQATKQIHAAHSPRLDQIQPQIQHVVREKETLLAKITEFFQIQNKKLPELFKSKAPQAALAEANRPILNEAKPMTEKISHLLVTEQTLQKKMDPLARDITRSASAAGVSVAPALASTQQLR